MGKRKPGDPEPEDKQPKPKKIFVATFDLWDDGEITYDLVEKVQGERGAPKAWRLDPAEWMTSVKARLSENKMKILAEMCKGLSITEEEIKQYYAPGTKKTESSDNVTTPVVSKNTASNDGFDFESKE